MSDNVQRRRIVVGISGASGAQYGIALLQAARSLPDLETHLIISPAARLIIAAETDWTAEGVAALADRTYAYGNVAAELASGSAETAGMVVAPCSIKTLSAIANCYASSLLTRAADVTLKEGRPLILVVRETPLHLGHLRLMCRAAEMGAVIFPPVPALYGRPATVQEVIDATVGRILARLGFGNGLYPRWHGLPAAVDPPDEE